MGRKCLRGVNRVGRSSMYGMVVSFWVVVTWKRSGGGIFSEVGFCFGGVVVVP